MASTFAIVIVGDSLNDIVNGVDLPRQAWAVLQHSLAIALSGGLQCGPLPIQPACTYPAESVYESAHNEPDMLSESPTYDRLGWHFACLAAWSVWC